MATHRLLKLSELNPEQQSAAIYDHKKEGGPLLILAGAGSGKTSTVAASVAYHLTNGQAPERVLMMTFTNKAAKAMINKISEFSEGASKIVAGTFHSIAYRLLIEIGRPGGFYRDQKVLGEYQMQRVWEKAYESALSEAERQAIKETKVGTLGQIQSWNSLLVTGGHSLEELGTILPDTKYWDPVVPSGPSRVILRYRQLKQDFHAFDFDDILSEYHRMLMYPEFRTLVQQRFDRIYVDEYQDTCVLQGEILKEMLGAHTKLTVVGDPNQCIFSFMSATITNILNFEKAFPGAKTIKLDRNYRSYEPILNVSNKIMEASNECIYNPLKSVQGAFLIKPHIHKYGSANSEALGVLRDIKAALARGVKQKDIAVLIRQSSISYQLETELEKNGISFVKVGGLKLTAKAHVRQYIAYLEILINKYNWLAWETILPMVPLIGKDLSKVLVEDIKAAGTEWDWSSMPPLSIGSGKRYHSFKIFWEQMQKVETLKGVSEVDFYEKSFSLFKPIFERYWDSAPATEKTEDNDGVNTMEGKLEEIHEYIVKMGTERKESLKQFLDQFNLDDSRSTKPNPENVMTISTIHSAKGLEWKVVFVIGVEQGGLPVDSRFHGSTSKCLGEKYPGFQPYREAVYSEEERRLFYVAVTRAEEELHITYATNRFGQGRKDSPFLKPFICTCSGTKELHTHKFTYECMSENYSKTSGQTYQHKL